SSGFRQGPSRSIMLEIVTSPMVSVRIWSYLVCLPPWPNVVEAGLGSHTSYIAVSCCCSHFELMPRIRLGDCHLPLGPRATGEAWLALRIGRMANFCGDGGNRDTRS